MKDLFHSRIRARLGTVVLTRLLKHPGSFITTLREDA